MNDFDDGFMWGRFFMSWIINDDFFGLAIRIGREVTETAGYVYHITIHIGYGQLTIGIIGGDRE